MDCGGTILLFLAFIQGTCGQSVTLSVVPPVVERGMNTVFTCTGGTSPYAFTWLDISEGSAPIFSDGQKSTEPKYLDFTLSENEDTSVMTIMNTRIEDEGEYRCLEGLESDGAAFTVEVQATLSLSVANPLRNGIMYNATCEAQNGRPEVTTSITWRLGTDGSFCSSTGEEDLPADTDLFSKRSWCTFQADSSNNGETLRCIINGHQLASLNGEETTTLNIESAPAETGIITVGFQFQNPNLTVSCVIDAAADQSNPPIMYYYIYRNGTLIHQSDRGASSVDVAEPDFATDFLCVAGNYLGNTTSPVATYDPTRTTTPSPPTEPITTEGPTTVPPTEDLMTSPGPNDDRNNTAQRSGPKSPSAAAIGGGVAGAIVVIIIVIVIIYFVKRGKEGPSAASSTKKHGSSAVGTSNGSEKDKIKPVAAPRDQGSIQHTTDNPGQAEYAMVDRKKPGGGDMPDTRGPGQKEPQGMLYADLDLSASAGHTEKKVPQNKDDVVVYSSILV